MKRTLKLLLPGLVLLPAAVWLLTPPAMSDPPEEDDGRLEAICPSDELEMSPERYLRALSLDLRGDIPTLEEYRQVQDAGEVGPELIEGWLASGEFTERAVRRHRDLLWPNVSNVRLTANNAGLTRQGGTNLYWRRNPGTIYRGDRVPCLNQPATYNPDGSIETFPQPDGTNREGFVMVEPYWAPGTQVKVCAFDAQETLFTGNGTDCSRGGYGDAACGCGPNLRHCRGPGTEQQVTAAMAEDLELRIADVIRNDRPYTELFTSRTAYVNGPLVHFYRYWNGVGRMTLRPVPVALDLLPDLAFDEADTWVPIQLSEEHAGILTSPLYLLRFQTNRARANNYYINFLCQPFQPPAGALPTTDGVPMLDLQKRDGCKYCHAPLEPAAAHWGRWTETGIGFLNPEDYPAMREDCRNCALGLGGCSADCRNNYLTSPLTSEQDPWLGWLLAYEFRDPAHHDNVELGPRLLALGSAVDGRLPTCAAAGSAEWLLGRPLVAEDQRWVDGLAMEFVSRSFSYKELVREIVTSRNYRRIR